MGTIEPAEVVDVGAEVGGRIVKLDADYNSKVVKGQVLAVIGDAVYRARLDEAEAALKGAEAQLALAKAKSQAAAAATRRATTLAAAAGISQADLDVTKVDELSAKAAVNVALAEVARQKAVVRAAQLNLDATKIKSPVDGVVIDRRVNLGQTVTPSLDAPSLFLIAADLKKLQIWAAVNEGDIGKIQVGQHAQFTVDAFPKRSFQGKVAQVRLNAQMTRNVVTYTVVVNVDNADAKLLPYMTAHLRFDVAEQKAGARGCPIAMNSGVRPAAEPRGGTLRQPIRGAETAAAALAVVCAEKSSKVCPRAAARRTAVWTTFAGSFRLPRSGSGDR